MGWVFLGTGIWALCFSGWADVEFQIDNGGMI